MWRNIKRQKWVFDVQITVTVYWNCYKLHGLFKCVVLFIKDISEKQNFNGYPESKTDIAVFLLYGPLPHHHLTRGLAFRTLFFINPICCPSYERPPNLSSHLKCKSSGHIKRGTAVDYYELVYALLEWLQYPGHGRVHLKLQ